MKKFSGPFEDVEVREPDEHGVLRKVRGPTAAESFRDGYKHGSATPWLLPDLTWRLLAVAAFLAFLFWRHW